MAILAHFQQPFPRNLLNLGFAKKKYNYKGGFAPYFTQNLGILSFPKRNCLIWVFFHVTLLRVLYYDQPLHNCPKFIKLYSRSY